MTIPDSTERPAEAFRDAETENLRAWARLSGREKIEFFEEMIALAYSSGALRPERLALRDAPLDRDREGLSEFVAPRKAE